MWMVRVRGLGWKEDAWGGCHRIVQSTSEIQTFPAVLIAAWSIVALCDFSFW